MAQATVLGIQIPDLSALENLGISEDLSEDFTAPVLVEDVSLSEDFELSESESKTINAAEQLTETANLQKSLDEGFGIDPTLPTAPGKLGGIIHAAKVSGLIGVLQTIAEFEGLNPIAAAANAIDSAVRKLGRDLMESKLADDTGNYFNKHANSIRDSNNRFGGLFKDGGGSGSKTSDGKSKKDEPLEIPSSEDLEKKDPSTWPDMIGDSIRKLDEYVAKTPKSQIQRTSLADLMIDSLGSSLSTDLSKLDLQDLVARAKMKAERKYAAHIINESDSKKEASSSNTPEFSAIQSEAPNTDNNISADNSNDGTNNGNKNTDDEKSEAIKEAATVDDNSIADDDEDDDSNFEITVKALDQSDGEKMISFPDLPKVANKMAKYDLRGRNTWDQKKAASKTLKKIDELEKLKEEKIKQFKEAREQTEAKEAAESQNATRTEELVSIEEQAKNEVESKIDAPAKTPELPKNGGTNTINELTNVGEQTNPGGKPPANESNTDGSAQPNRNSNPNAQASKNIAKTASFTSKTETAEKAPTTEEELALKLAKESGAAAKEAMISSTLTANSAVEVMNQASSTVQSLVMSPAAANPEMIDRIKNLSSTSTKSSAEASGASMDALKNFKLTMEHLAAGDLEKAVDTRDLSVKNAEEAKIAKLKVQKARQELAKLKEIINSDGGTPHAKEKRDNREEAKKRFIKGKVDQAVSSAMKDMGGNILSPSGLSSIAEKVTAIQINIPAITVVNASLSTEMLLKATAKLALFLSLKSTFGDNLLGPTGGASIQASINAAISAAASIGGSAGGSGGLGGSAGGGLGGGLGGSAGGGLGASAGVGVGASLSATAAIGALGDLLGSSPSVMAILLLKGILLQLKMLGNDVVETNACYLSLYSMAGKDAKKYYEGRLAQLEEEMASLSGKNREEPNQLDSSAANSGSNEKSDGVDKNDNSEESEDDVGNENESDGEQNENSDQSDDDQESEDQKLSAANPNFADIPQKGSWFQTSRRASLKSSLSDKFGTGNSKDSDTSAFGIESDLGSTGNNLNLSGLSNSDTSDSDSSSSDSSNLSDLNISDSDSGEDEDPEPDPSDSSWFQSARRTPLKSDLEDDSDAGNMGDSDASSGAAASGSENADGADDQDGSGTGGSTDDRSQPSDDGSGNLSGTSSTGEDSGSESSIGGKVAAGVAAGAIGAAGIGAMAAMAMRNKGGRGGAGGDGSGLDGGEGNADGSEGADFAGCAGDDRSGIGDTDGASSGSGLETGTAGIGAGFGGDADDGPWHQKAKHNEPSKKVSENIYAVGDPTTKAKQDENEEGSETDSSNFEETEQGNKWHRRAKHDNTTELRPERLSDAAIEGAGSETDDSKKSS